MRNPFTPIKAIAVAFALLGAVPAQALVALPLAVDSDLGAKAAEVQVPQDAASRLNERIRQHREKTAPSARAAQIDALNAKLRAARAPGIGAQAPAGKTGSVDCGRDAQDGV